VGKGNEPREVTHSQLPSIKKVHFSCMAVAKTGSSDKDSRLHSAGVTPRTSEQTGMEEWKSLLY